VKSLESWGPFSLVVLAAGGLVGADVTQDGSMELDGYLAGVGLLLLAWEARAARSELVGNLRPMAEAVLEELSATRAQLAELRETLQKL
jgi:hypothetical protein